MEIETLRSLITKYPEWADLPIGVCRSDGLIDFVGASGFVFDHEYNDNPNADIEKSKDNYKVLVFSGN